MSETKRDGGPAFPIDREAPEYGHGARIHEPGMTLRDYMAGQALASWTESHHKETIGLGTYPEQMAHVCYAIADAMLAERTK